jgi:hypothetical protein
MDGQLSSCLFFKDQGVPANKPEVENELVFVLGVGQVIDRSALSLRVSPSHLENVPIARAIGMPKEPIAVRTYGAWEIRCGVVRKAGDATTLRLRIIDVHLV